MPKDLQIPTRETELILSELASTFGVDGDVVEFGCYAGDTSVLLADALRNHPNKWLWLYDSFQGLPQKTVFDRSATGQNFRAGELRVSPEVVVRKFRKLQLPEPAIKAAWFDELDPEQDLPSQISFALLDGDFYESIKTSLSLVAPRIANGGSVVVHDYRNVALPGVAKAVDEFLAEHNTLTLRRAASLAIISF